MDLLRLIKGMERHEELIIVTAFGSLETAVEALSLGVFDYVAKPFKPEHIIFTVDRVMRWQSVKRDAVRTSTIFDGEPYESVRQAIERAHVRRLAKRRDADKKGMAEHSGLPPQTIGATLKSDPPDAGQAAA